MIIVLILSALAGLGLLALLAGWWHNRQIPEPDGSEETGEQPAAADVECCGQHEVCEKDSLLAAVSKQIDYYNDEELDRFRGRDSAAYSDAENEEFREVLYTMREEEVAGWVRSLQLRGVPLPDALKDEVFLIIGERRLR